MSKLHRTRTCFWCFSVSISVICLFADGTSCSLSAASAGSRPDRVPHSVAFSEKVLIHTVSRREPSPTTPTPLCLASHIQWNYLADVKNSIPFGPQSPISGRWTVNSGKRALAWSQECVSGTRERANVFRQARDGANANSARFEGRIAPSGSEMLELCKSAPSSS